MQHGEGGGGGAVRGIDAPSRVPSKTTRRLAAVAAVPRCPTTNWGSCRLETPAAVLGRLAERYLPGSCSGT